MRFVTRSFPLRTTDSVSSQLDALVRPTLEDELYARVRGPGNIMRPQQLSAPLDDVGGVLQSTPVLARQRSP